ncbi:MAG: transglutaminase-like domain-containing protein [Phycisphaerae bacterium]
MNRTFARVLSVSLCLAIAPAAPAEKRKRIDFANPPAGVFMDEWYAVLLDKAQCGSMHATTRRDGDTIESRADIVFNLTRDRAKVSIKVEQAYRESLGGQPLGFESTMRMGDAPVVQQGTVRNGKITLVTKQFGAEQRAEHDFDPEVRFAWGQFLEQQRRGLKPGTRFTLKTYEPTLAADHALVAEFAVRGWETIDLLGRQTKALRVTTTMKLDQPIESEAWVDADGTPLVNEVNLGAFHIRMVRCDEKTARKLDRAPEMFNNTFITATGRVRRDAPRLTLRLSTADGARLPDLPNTEMQTFRRDGESTGTLEVARLDWAALRAGESVPKAPPRRIRREFLRASAYCDINDAQIQKLSRKAVGDAALPAAKADRLRKFVTGYITNKGLDVAMATATEVARRRQGDCTEHGVLLAALARAAGLPARCVAGLVMAPDSAPDRPLFGYHMWTQVWIDGRWIDIDAAMRQTDCDPTHVALAIMSMNDESLMSGAMNIVALIGRLKIEVVSADR